MNRRGFSLVELLIVMVIFAVIMMISASSFESIIKINMRESKSIQSQIEGTVGLEILRGDIAAAGYGIPWSFQITPDVTKYLEADLGADNPIKGLSADDFNDAPANKDVASPPPIAAPRAVVVGSVPTGQAPMIGGVTNTNPGTDYLVFKSAMAAFNTVVGKWAFVNYSSTAGGYITKKNSTQDLLDNEVVTAHRNVFSGSNQRQHELAMENAQNFSFKLTTKNTNGNFVPPNTNYMPSGSYTDPSGVKINTETMLVYGIKKLDAGSTDTLRMPYNRADYFVMRPSSSMPAKCNKGTGVLYKAVIINTMDANGGGRTLYPLLDCVGDMQVIFDMQDSVDANKTMTVDTLSGLTAADIRSRLKSVRVYILTHEGSKDTGYTYPYTNASNVITVADDKTPSLGRVFSATDMQNFFGTDWRNYRWKVYTIVGTPYNLRY
jgi:prepilin-type N-terminal cleavage/methylation domain-containing protein